MTIRERDWFKVVDLWAKKECERRGLSTKGTVKRKVLGEDVVKRIGFPAMKEKDFVNDVIDSEILTSEEVFDVMKYFNSVSSIVSFPKEERNGSLLHAVDLKGWQGMKVNMATLKKNTSI